MWLVRRLFVGLYVLFVAVCAVYLVAVGITGSTSLDAPAAAQLMRPQEPVPAPAAPGQREPVPSGMRQRLQDTPDSSADMWRALRGGLQGSVSLPNKQAGLLIQSEGENWRNLRNGPLYTYGAWAILGMVLLLAAFFAFRGRIRIEQGRSGATIRRFNGIERFGHWLTAVSFILLALTGLNILYGRYLLLPLIGPGAFSAITQAGKAVHNYVAFAFMFGLLMIFVLWVGQNIPNRHDLLWLAKGGGMFTRGSHPPARKFNAGQKILFWAVILGGLSVSLSGIALLWPFEFALFGKTFAVLNWFGLDLPTDLRPIQEMQLSQLWHAAVGLILVAIIIAHIYIGTLGMEGAFDAMGTGQVDRNWAREHHALWVDEIESRARAGGDD